jgi:hypothetical protein
LPALPETLHKLAQSAAQHVPGRGATQKAAKIAQNAAKTALLTRFARPAAGLPLTAKHPGNLLPVLVTRNGEQPQERNHGRHSAAIHGKSSSKPDKPGASRNVPR